MPAGGKQPGSGRKPKITELALIERLTPLEDSALKKLKEGIDSGQFHFIKLFMEYMYGKPKESMQISGDKNNPIESIVTINIKRNRDK